MQTSSQKNFRNMFWAFIAFNLFVILWGTLVRATHAGAGCGNHWPTCNGQIIPLDASIETTIEFTHRLTSGLDGIFGLALLVWAWRAFPLPNKTRWGMILVVIFLIIEGAIGAALVRLDLVAGNQSLARGWVQGGHLVNTLVLLGIMLQTQAWAHYYQHRLDWWRNLPAITHLLLSALLLVIGAFGAITALGDTLFPAQSLQHGLLQDLDPTSHPFIQMRVWHPILAIFASVGMVYWAARYALPHLRWQVSLLVVAQVLLGGLNILLLAPIWLQLVHHLVADLLFLSWVWAGMRRFTQATTV